MFLGIPLSRKRAPYYLNAMEKSLTHIIQSRRSVFPAQYTGKSIPKADLLTILEAARWAPNHAKTQPWRYKVLQGDALAQLGDFLADSYLTTADAKEFTSNKLRHTPRAASAIVLLFMERDPKERIPEWEEVAAVAMSVQNMWLTAHNLGYGSYWSSPKSFANMADFEPITVGERERFLGFYYIGTTDVTEQELPERLAVEEFVQFVGE
ncbi:MAG: nitroreductase [Nonlabens sp.]|nr:nitroreductase [Nonlabens sp.]